MAIADAFPLDGETALAAVYQSQGWADDADDEEIRRAQSLLGRREGIFAESASAAAYVVVEKMRRSGKIRDGECVVCVVTGNGVKELPRIEGEMELPEPVACEISALKRYLASQFQIRLCIVKIISVSYYCKKERTGKSGGYTRDELYFRSFRNAYRNWGVYCGSVWAGL